MRALALALALGALAPPVAALALEPTTVRVEGVVTLSPGLGSVEARERAFRAALEEAVFEVARGFASPTVLELEEPRIREALAPSAPGFVLTYRVHGAPQRRPSGGTPGAEELVLTVTATVDAGQVRDHLQAAGLLRAEGDRPSVALWVHPAADDELDSLLTRLEAGLARRLERAGYIVVDPALRPGAARARSALDLARVLGADLGVDVGVGWRERELQAQVSSGVATVRLLALRTRDAVALAEGRFEAPAHHADRDEAILRALEALQSQVGDNLVLQLDRNWRALGRDEGPVTLALSNVTSLLQVEAVQRTLRNVLGAEQTALVELGPSRAAIEVQGPLSPGALQERLTAIAFEGFRLEPLEVRPRGVDLRVAPESEPAPQIDTPGRN